jgi:uroporphyrin-III C-methyltransferase
VTDWEALACGADALVLYMALGQAGAIADRLIAAGRPAHEPLAFITDATSQRQQVCLATVDTAAAT